MSNRKIMLIDGSSLAFRAFFSILDLERFKNSAGLHTNALYSFHRMLDNVMAQFEPTHVLVAFDQAGPTFRTEKYKEYKGGRQKTPSEFKEQMPYFKVLLEGYGIAYYDMSLYEADDIIGTLAHQADTNDEVIVISGDKDLIQIADDNTTVYITRKGVSDLEGYTPEHILEKYQVTPRQIIELKGLMGDSSDNYPGVTRIGEKTAIKLIKEFNSVEELYRRIDELKASKMKENLVNDEANAHMSRDLAEIRQDVPLELSWDDILYQGKNIEALLEFYRQMNFNSFITNLQEAFPDQVESLHEDMGGIDFQYEYLETIDANHLPDESVIYLESLGENYHVEPIEIVAWIDKDHAKVYLAKPDIAFASQDFLAWLGDPDKKLISFDSKRDRVYIEKNGAQLEGIVFDISIAAYLVDLPNLQEIADISRHFEIPLSVQLDEFVYGKGAKRQVPEADVMYSHVANKVVALGLLHEPLKARLVELEMEDLYLEIDFPLAEILAEIELRGFKVDGDILIEKSQEVDQRLASMEESIYKLAGQTFNINSPKQLGVILFEELGLPVIKRTKSGYSTAADVLDKLVNKHPIIQEILDYRQLAKLQSTYLKGLPSYILDDGKIHTRLIQTLTQTGRLSSADPNLQNIPIRIEEGKRIRQAFIPSQDHWQLFSADYSQIELRVLAHISGDEYLRQAFIDGEDIHSATARRIFELPEGLDIDSHLRRQAKAVNFGIVYGISDYGLSQNLNISRPQAKEFIDRYFKMYPGVKDYMEDIVAEAKEKGYVSTLFHRRRYLPDINASNFNLRSFAERTAINSPIQGTAADILKIAMVELDRQIKAQKLQARILLQVHDELILEAPSEEMEILSDLVPKVMEEAVELSVPLLVDYDQGNNWYELG